MLGFGCGLIVLDFSYTLIGYINFFSYYLWCIDQELLSDSFSLPSHPIYNSLSPLKACIPSFFISILQSIQLIAYIFEVMFMTKCQQISFDAFMPS